MDSLDRLDEHQKRTLHQYQSITHSDDIAGAVRTLTGHDWNLEEAVQSSYVVDDESPSASSSLLGNRPPVPPRPSTARRSRLLSLFSWPFNIVWGFSLSIIQLAIRLLHRPSITPPRRDPRSEADRFLREFESNYGTRHPEFFPGGYSQALAKAKEELKYLLVILQSDEHDDTDKFCRESLTSSELQEFCHQHQILVWGSNVRNSEAFQVSNTLQATTYPFMAIIALQPISSTSSSTKMAVIERMEGPISAAAIIQRFEAVMTRAGATLNRYRAEREQRELERRLREEQENAYRESLRNDQEKERQRKQKLEQEKRAEEARILEKKNKELYLDWICQKFIVEPTPTENEKLSRISFKLVNGDRVIRKFKYSDSLETLYEFVEVYPRLKDFDRTKEYEKPAGYKHQFDFTLLSPFPRVVYNPDPTKTIGEQSGLYPTAALIVDADTQEEGTDSETEESDMDGVN